MIRISTCVSASEVDPAALQGRTAVVIDLVRATSVMIEALASGVRSIAPTLTSEDAVRLATTLGREDTLLGGERRGLRIDGFDLGNSPEEFTPETVKGKRLVMNTTNGTRAFLAAQPAERVLAAALLNLSAVAELVVRDGRDITIICAGKDGRFGIDDMVCAGLLVSAVSDRVEEVELDDASRAALTLSRLHPADAAFLRSTAAGRALVEIGLEKDLDYCAQRDLHGVVPEMHDRIIRAAEGTEVTP